VPSTPFIRRFVLYVRHWGLYYSRGRQRYSCLYPRSDFFSDYSNGLVDDAQVEPFVTIDNGGTFNTSHGFTENLCCHLRTTVTVSPWSASFYSFNEMLCMMTGRRRLANQIFTSPLSLFH
jgi:hypothetical protein